MPKEPAAQKPQLPSIGKEKLQGELSSGGKLRQCAPGRAESSKGTPQAPSGGASSGSRSGGAKHRGHSARIRTPPHRREQWVERRGEEKRDNAGPGRRFRTLHGSPAPLPPRAASGRAKFAAPPSLPGPGRRSGGRRPPPRLAATAFLPAGRLPGVREAAARARQPNGSSEGSRARDGEGARKEAARVKGAGRAGERGARRSPRTRRRSGGFSNEAGSAPRRRVRCES